jgi:hypothetical protein
MFGSSAPAPVAPAVIPPPTMPDPQSPAALAAKVKAEQDAMGRAGRSSTILSSAVAGAGAGGGSSYGSAKLGASS